jgi:hypothetical protein
MAEQGKGRHRAEPLLPLQARVPLVHGRAHELPRKKGSRKKAGVTSQKAHSIKKLPRVKNTREFLCFITQPLPSSSSGP